MLLRFVEQSLISATPPASAWEVFSATQERRTACIGCVSQPSHAVLAGHIASSLEADVFGVLPPEVVDTIQRHDAGWAQADLSSLETSEHFSPISFLALPASGAVEAWRQCVRAAERHSLLAGILTSRHFCLLASTDDPLHLKFQEEETRLRAIKEEGCSVAQGDLDRYLSALGFCDLLSLYLCSGTRQPAWLPLAHPADPASAKATRVTIDLSGNLIRFNFPILQPGSKLEVSCWKVSDSGNVMSHKLDWTCA